MTQASLQLQQFVNRIWHQIDAIQHFNPFKRYSRKLEASKGWLLGLAVLLLLWLWNWQLVLSGSMGLAAWVLVYLVQQGQWQLPQINWQALWKPSNRALTLAFVSGTIVCFSTYLTLAIWRESGGSWLGKGMILEGFGILTIGLLLLWQCIAASLSNPTNRDQSSNQGFEQWLNDLSASDALKRLIAVQRLTQWVSQSQVASPADRTHSLPPLPPAELAACFRLMLDRETEPAVCRALMDSLQTLNQKQSRSLQLGASLPVHALEHSRIEARRDEG